VAEAPTPTAASAPRAGTALRSFEGRALGSPLRLSVNGATRPDASAAWRAVVAEFASVDAALSRFRDDSELTALNRAAGSGSHLEVTTRLRAALVLMDRARRVTRGRFDPRVLGDLERLGERGAELGARMDGAHAERPVARPSGPVIRVSRERTVTIEEPVDTGGVGKGLALRWAARAASAALPLQAGLLIEAGGDVVAVGRHPLGGWRIGIEDPREPDGAVVAVARLDRGAIATSSIRIRHWRDDRGRLVHHLIDPVSGEPADDGLVAVTVADHDPAWAEIRSKSLFLAGAGRIGDEARALGLAAWWVGEDGRMGMTPGARLCSIWVAD
jgi:thiamine biosynthesis lipoprotein